jgi:hypothetical protein
MGIPGEKPIFLTPLLAPGMPLAVLDEEGWEVK